MKKFVLVYSFFALLVAHSAFAAVVINEIAWMGTASSSASEWIELHNTGSDAQDLTGWKIIGKSNAVITSLSGAVAPDGYFLIERGSDNTVPNVTADLVASFSKGLGNDGETLKLLDGGGTVVDTVVGGKHWSKIGGDNTSKQTAQLSTTGWITAPATPRSPNKTPALAQEIEPKTKTVPKVEKVASEHVTKSLLTTKNLLAAPAVSRSSEITPLATSSSVGASVIWQRKIEENAAKDAWAWMIFALLLVIAAGVIIAKTNVSEPSEADKYAIIEDIIESKEDDRLGDY